MHFSSFAYFNSGLDCRDVGDFDELGALIRAISPGGKKKKSFWALAVRRTPFAKKNFRTGMTWTGSPTIP